MNTCKSCGITNKDVLKHEAKVGGSDELVTQIYCRDINACLKRAKKEE